MPPIPPPRAHGFTTTTPVPLYWAEYGDADAPPLLAPPRRPRRESRVSPAADARARRASIELVHLRPARRRPLRHDDDRAVIGWQRSGRRRRPRERPSFASSRSPSSATRGAGCSRCSTRSRPRRPRRARARRASRSSIRRRSRAPYARRRSSRSSRAARRAPPSPRCAPSSQASGLRERDPDAYRQRAFELSVAGYFADPPRAHDLTPFRVTGRVQQSIWAVLGDFDLHALAVDSVRVPTLVVHGAQDPIPLASSEAAARALGTTCVVIEASGHVPYVEQPAQLFAALRDFPRATPRSTLTRSVMPLRARRRSSNPTSPPSSTTAVAST